MYRFVRVAFIFLLICVSVGLKSQETNEISGCFHNLENKSGLYPVYEGSPLSNISCRLDSVADSLGANTFLIGNIIGYPLRHSFKAKDGMAYLRNIHLGELDVLSDGYFVFFIDYSYEREGEISYELSLPYSGKFANLDEGERRYIQIILESEFEDNINLAFDVLANNMIAKLSALLSGAESLEFSTEDLDFIELQFEAEVVYPVLTESGSGISTHLEGFGIHDYSGLLNEGSPLGNEIAEVPDFVDLNIGVYITSDLNAYTKTYFNQALTTFGQESEDFSLWVHIAFNESDGSYKLSGKSHTNLTEDEALLWLANYFNESNSNDILSLTSREETDVLSKSLNACDGKPSDFSGVGEKLFGENNAHGKDWTIYCIFADDYIDSPNVIEDPFGVYEQARVGTTAGVADGLIGTVFGIGALFKGLKFVRETNPFSFSFWSSLVEDAISEWSMKKAWKMKTADVETMWNIFKVVGKLLLESGRPFWIQGVIANEIIKYLKSIAGSSALYNTAYISGLIIFEVIVEVLTAGSAFMVTALARLANLGADVGRFGTKLAAMGRSGANRILDQTRWGEFFTNIQSGMKRFDGMPRKRTAVGAHRGCFLGATLVALSGGLNATPIQDVQLFDLVESKEITEEVVFASTEGGWGNEEAYLSSKDLVEVDFTRERWLVGEFEGAFDSTILTVAREARWFKENNLSIGDVSFLSLSELGLSGEYVLNNTREVAPEEYHKLSQGRGRSRPVTATVSYPVMSTLRIYTASDTIGVTPNHLFFSRDRNDWVVAGNLKVGELLETSTGGVEVNKIDTLSDSQLRVYNIEVDENHNYYVGSGQLLVHNTCLEYVDEIFGLYPENSRGTVYVLEPGTGRVTDQIDELGTFLANLDAVKKDAFRDDLRRVAVADQGKMVKSVRAWEALSETALRTNTYWLERVSRWQSAGLNFNYVDNGISVSVYRSTDEVAILTETNFIHRYLGFGGDVVCPSDRTTTIIGLTGADDPDGLTGTLFFREIGLYKNHLPPNDNLGGINLLNIQNYTWARNQSWLRNAAERGDIIRIISDPADPRTIWRNGIPEGQPGHNGFKTITGKEIDLLRDEFGYVFDPSTNSYKPN
jgi:hypothetical protein